MLAWFNFRGSQWHHVFETACGIRRDNSRMTEKRRLATAAPAIKKRMTTRRMVRVLSPLPPLASISRVLPVSAGIVTFLSTAAAAEGGGQGRSRNGDGEETAFGDVALSRLDRDSDLACWPLFGERTAGASARQSRGHKRLGTRCRHGMGSTFRALVQGGSVNHVMGQAPQLSHTAGATASLCCSSSVNTAWAYEELEANETSCLPEQLCLSKCGR